MRETTDFSIRTKLKEIGKGVDFSTIKEGDIFHIPRILEIPRKTVLVQKVCGNNIRCEVEVEGGAMQNEWIYDFELQSKFMVPYKEYLRKRTH